MKAGRDLDVLVGSEYFNYQWYSYDGYKRLKGLVSNKHINSDWIKNLKKYNNLVWHDAEPKELKLGAYEGLSFSTKISDAWQVVGKFEDEGYQVCIELLAKKIYSVGIYYPPHADQVAYIKAETAPLALCLAALKAKGIDVNKS